MIGITRFRGRIQDHPEMKILPIEIRIVGIEWGQIRQESERGLTLARLTPRYIWLPSADSNHGPDG
jgi:hypothetical protein